MQPPVQELVHPPVQKEEVQPVQLVQLLVHPIQPVQPTQMVQEVQSVQLLHVDPVQPLQVPAVQPPVQPVHSPVQAVQPPMHPVQPPVQPMQAVHAVHSLSQYPVLNVRAHALVKTATALNADVATAALAIFRRKSRRDACLLRAGLFSEFGLSPEVANSFSLRNTW